jgi:hypothetical protein
MCGLYALPDLGLSSKLDVFSGTPQAAAGVVNALFALIQQRQVQCHAGSLSQLC